MTSFALWTRERAERIERVLDRVLPPPEGPAARLHEAMRYATLGGGKRMRPLLAYAAGELADADPADVDHVAAAVELIHAYSLIHDDLPCMDDDALRRGKPTVHVAFDEATALLAGDALQSLAFGTLARARTSNVANACALLADAAGSRGMAGGQAIDLAATGKMLDATALAAMHRLKTGALVGAAVRLGAHCGRALAAPEVHALDRFVDAAGLAFQVIDDVLDVEGSAAALGKTPGKDAAHGKPTFVSALGLAGAKAEAERLRGAANDALETFGAPAQRLRELSDWIVLRRQ
ncbi:MAG TPA: farnesyl diphosphate synthase [Casimicrobiaceae bacterium]